MLIVNPIYDVAFKALLQEERIAKFFIGTLTGENVIAVEPAPQEHVHYDPGAKSPTLFRMDFVAVIRTEKGEERILIEMQKAPRSNDMPRFRRYLGDSYANDNKSLPITTIYILGFVLPGIETPCLKVAREYYDLVNQKPINKKNYYVEQLSHDCYIVQTPLVKARYQTHIDQLLNVFQQVNFVPCEESKNKKNLYIEYDYNPQLTSPDVKLMLDKLHYIATDPAVRKELDAEIYYYQYLEDNFGESDKVIAEKDKMIAEKDNVISEKDNVISEKDNVISEKDNVIAAQAAELEALRKMFENKEKE
jgi:hypothetical protein